MAQNKLIVKNTIFMYTRMILIMGVTLYASRVVLDKLGVQDFSLYNVVGGIVGMLSFLNGTLSTGTSRFITYELGTKDENRLLQTYRTSVFAHLLLALIITAILETAGLWYVYCKMVIPPERLFATLVVYHISIFATFISIVQIPYTALIIAPEDMKVYAYVGIFDAMARLGVVFCLSIGGSDKLIMYAALTAVAQLLVSGCYALYCMKHYRECKFGFTFNKQIFKSLICFSGWNVLANLSETLKLQGYLILTNLFFQPFMVAAQTIANQVSGALIQFINNFRNAVNPQIIKLYASKQYEESKQLTMQTTVYVFELCMLIGLPAIFIMKTIMNIWLVEVPDYAVVFTQYIIVQRIIGSFDSAFYTPMVAAAKIKSNSIFAAVSGPLMFVALYFIFKEKGDVMWMMYLGVIFQCAFGFFIKPILLTRDVESYRLSDFLSCFITCAKVTAVSLALTFGAYKLTGNDGIPESLALATVSALSVALASYIFLDKAAKTKINAFVLKKVGLLKRR